MNPFDVLKNMQNIQSRVSEMQEKMKDVVITGTSGGDMVAIDLNGQMEVQDVRIAPEAVDPQDVGMLQDLIIAAFNDAQVKLKDTLKDQMSDITGGLDLPPGMMGM